MNIHENHHSEAGSKGKKRVDLFARVVKSFIGALIGTTLTSLFSLVIFAFVVKAFTTDDAMSFQLLNSALAVVAPALGAVLGYFLVRNSGDKRGPDS